MILELDCGNSLIKWRLLAGSAVVQRGKVADLGGLAAVVRGIGVVRKVRVCSVRDENFAVQLRHLLSGVTAQQLWAASQQQLAGVTNGYPEYWKLGVDRWLALVAGYNRGAHGCLVIDCGTALTADFVTTSGQHLGGVIAPGLRLLRQSLLGSTALQVREEQGLGCVEPGENTGAAIDAGIAAMVQGFMAQQLVSAESLLGSGYQVWLTGGDAQVLLGCCPDALVVEDLLFEGLSYLQVEE